MTDEQDKVSKYVMYIKELGVPVVMLLILSFGAYKGVAWVAENLLVPLVQDQRENNKEMSGYVKALVSSQDKIVDESVKHTSKLEAIHDDVKQIRDAKAK